MEFEFEGRSELKKKKFPTKKFLFFIFLLLLASAISLFNLFSGLFDCLVVGLLLLLAKIHSNQKPKIHSHLQGGEKNGLLNEKSLFCCCPFEVFFKALEALGGGKGGFVSQKKKKFFF